MNTDDLQENSWYWIRRPDGSLVPYRFHRLAGRSPRGVLEGEFFVGSFIQKWPLSSVVGEARMPEAKRASKAD